MGNILPFRRPEDVPCPAGGHDVDRDRVRCPHCRAAIVPGGGTSKMGLPGWMWIGVLLAALVLLGLALLG